MLAADAEHNNCASLSTHVHSAGTKYKHVVECAVNKNNMPTLVDLFSGRFGWCKGFLELGWNCIAYDWQEPPCEIPKGIEFRKRNIFYVTDDDLTEGDFITCSSPCEQFSIHCMPKGFHKNPGFPHNGLALFNHAKEVCTESGKPFVMENVRCAQKFVGKAINHCGPFYLWGNAVPAIIPTECYRLTKGLYIGTGTQMRNMTREQLRTSRREARIAAGQWTSSNSTARKEQNSTARKEQSAKVAEIPMELSRYIAQVATNMLDSKAL